MPHTLPVKMKKPPLLAKGRASPAVPPLVSGYCVSRRLHCTAYNGACRRPLPIGRERSRTMFPSLSAPLFSCRGSLPRITPVLFRSSRMRSLYRFYPACQRPSVFRDRIACQRNNFTKTCLFFFLKFFQMHSRNVSERNQYILLFPKTLIKQHFCNHITQACFAHL